MNDLCNRTKNFIKIKNFLIDDNPLELIKQDKNNIHVKRN